jgi:hypothetical protein
MVSEIVPEITAFADLAVRLRALRPSCGPVRLVAVDGPGGSGKTTFAARLSLALGGVQVVHGDDFPIAWEGSAETWFALLDEQVLRPLAAGSSGRYRRFDWPSGGYAEWVEVPVAPLLIVEGVSTARLAAPTAFAVWVEAPAEVRLARVLARDGARYEPQWRTWMREEERWFALDRPRDRADLLVDGSTAGSEVGFVTLAGG